MFSELKVDISVFEILSPAPLTRLATRIVSRSSLVGAEIRSEAATESSD